MSIADSRRKVHGLVTLTYLKRNGGLIPATYSIATLFTKRDVQTAVM